MKSNHASKEEMKSIQSTAIRSIDRLVQLAMTGQTGKIRETAKRRLDFIGDHLSQVRLDVAAKEMQAAMDEV